MSPNKQASELNKGQQKGEGCHYFSLIHYTLKPAKLHLPTSRCEHYGFNKSLVNLHLL